MRSKTEIQKPLNLTRQATGEKDDQNAIFYTINTRIKDDQNTMSQLVSPGSLQTSKFQSYNLYENKR